MADTPADPVWLHAGRVGRPHGLDGSFLVAEPSPALLRASGTVKIADAVRAVERIAGYDARLILRLEGCHDRADAEALRGQTLFVSRDHAPELGQDEWWAADLEGLDVYDGDRKLGTVVRLLALPSCELLEVARAEGGEPLLVPLISDAVRTVDLEQQRVDIDLEFLGEA